MELNFKKLTTKRQALVKLLAQSDCYESYLNREYNTFEKLVELGWVRVVQTHGMGETFTLTDAGRAAYEAAQPPAPASAEADTVDTSKLSKLSQGFIAYEAATQPPPKPAASDDAVVTEPRDELIRQLMSPKWIDVIKDWRSSQAHKRLPSGLKDFYLLNDICQRCRGKGYETTYEPGLEIFVHSGICAECEGSGRNPFVATLNHHTPASAEAVTTSECWNCGTRHSKEDYASWPFCPACGMMAWELLPSDYHRQHQQACADERQRQRDALAQQVEALRAAVDTSKLSKLSQGFIAYEAATQPSPTPAPASAEAAGDAEEEQAARDEIIFEFEAGHTLRAIALYRDLHPEYRYDDAEHVERMIKRMVDYQIRTDYTSEVEQLRAENAELRARVEALAAALKETQRFMDANRNDLHPHLDYVAVHFPVPEYLEWEEKLYWIIADALTAAASAGDGEGSE